MSGSLGPAEVALGAWGFALAVAAADRVASRSLADGRADPDGPPVSVVVPARNEEGRLARALESLAGQSYRRLEVLVVDDESDDGTAAEARSVSSERVRVVAGQPLPAGWVGKSWANHQGARLARGEWLLFTDADVVFARDAVARAVSLARRLDRPGLTALCRLDSVSAAERIVQPAAAALIRGFVAPGPLVRSPRAPVAIAVGGFILVRREAYERAGGHESVRDRLVDDRALAERLKRLGTPLEIVDGHELLHVRMYHGLSELWSGWRKNASFGLGSIPRALVVAGAGAVLAVAPLLALGRGRLRIGLAGLALQLGARAAVDPIAPSPPRYVLTMPAGCLFLSVVSLASSVDRLRGSVAWRGRSYPGS